MKRKIWVRPGKTQSVAGIIIGIVFLLIGIFMVIPTFGPFGLLWTGIVVIMLAMNLYNVFSKKGIVSHEISVEYNENDIEKRLETLKSMYDKGLITAEEYADKRKQILDDM